MSTEPSMGLDKDMMPVPHAHPHVYEARWPVRMADVDSGGRLRLDGAARHIQDIGQITCGEWRPRRPTCCGSCVAP